MGLKMFPGFLQKQFREKTEVVTAQYFLTLIDAFLFERTIVEIGQESSKRKK